MFTIVSASTRDERDFHDNTFLGRSLRRLELVGVEFRLRLFPSNPPRVGLSELYNRAIDEDRSEQPMLLVHDDVSIEDMLIEEKLRVALQDFDVVGTAGGDAPVEAPAWRGNWPTFGCVAHADRDDLASILFPAVTFYGPAPAQCRVIDGHFMALIPAKIVEHNARFDPQFTLNHYDLDFCHSASAVGLRIGVWPIWVVHGSPGGYCTEPWHKSAAQYIKKVRDRMRHHR
jgi:GT2 family glycosyltransferase